MRHDGTRDALELRPPPCGCWGTLIMLAAVVAISVWSLLTWEG